MTRKMRIEFRTVEGITQFADAVSKISGKATILSGRYAVNAKSIMGIFSIDLTKPLILEIADWKEEYTELLKGFLYETVGYL